MTTAPTTLKKLTLTSFRGSTSTFKLEFEKNKKLTLIYGENGTGKTTICDAFEFLAAERVGSLEERGMGKNLEKFWPSAGKPAGALTVELETSAATCSGKIVGKQVSVSPLTARPRIELLRHRQILDLIQAQPAKRYDAIKRFIDIEHFQQSEDALRDLCKSLLQDKAQALAAEQENLSALQEAYEAAGSPSGLNAVSWAKQKLAEPKTDWSADIQAIGKLRSTFEALRAFPERLTARADAVATAEAALAAAEQTYSDAIEQATGGASEALAVLEAGRDYLHNHTDASVCPLCESSEKIGALSETIAARLKALSALKAADVARKSKHQALNNARIALTTTTEDYKKAVAAFTTAQAAHTWAVSVQLPLTPPPTDPAGLPTWLAVNAPSATAWASLEAAWRDESKYLTQLQAAVDRYDTNAARVQELGLLIPRADTALEECVAERQTFTDGIIGAIAQDVGKLYEAVHPGEGLDAIALPLDPAKRASIDLQAKFSGKDVPPQAYFSQSHLDTLGLCVFLALALRDKSDETVLILDDVLGSVDEPHVERVIGMIYEVSLKFRHTIITTHYRPWREKYRWGWLKPGQPCQFVELTGWALEDGMRLVNSMPEVDRLKALLQASPIDTQAVCGKAGVILEAALDYLTSKYECSVPRRFGAAYTLGDLLPAIGGKLRDALKVEIRDGMTDPAAVATNVVALKPILDELQRIAQARNAFGAHFKAISFELLDSDAVGFANQVVLLVDALTHPTDGWPSNDKSGSYWRNSGDSRRLHPLKKPA